MFTAAFLSVVPNKLGGILITSTRVDIENNCAVYCYGEVIEVTEVISKKNQETEAKKEYQHKVIFHFIREDDREVLVRTSLHEQSKQLQKLSQKRNQQSES